MNFHYEFTEQPDGYRRIVWFVRLERVNTVKIDTNAIEKRYSKSDARSVGCTMSIIFSTLPYDLFHWLTTIGRNVSRARVKRAERANRTSETEARVHRVLGRLCNDASFVSDSLNARYMHVYVRARRLYACRMIPIQSGRDSSKYLDCMLNRAIH